MTLTFLTLTWDATVGTLGGWKGTNTNCTGNPVTIEVYPSAGGGPGIVWNIKVYNTVVYDTRAVTAGCGQRFQFDDIVINPTACRRAKATVTVDWPGALP